MRLWLVIAALAASGSLPSWAQAPRPQEAVLPTTGALPKSSTPTPLPRVRPAQAKPAPQPQPLSREDAEVVREMALLEHLELVKNLELFEPDVPPERQQ